MSVNPPLDIRDLGWIAAGIAILLLILRDLIIEGIKSLLQWLGNAVYNRLSGTQFFRRTALKRYAQALTEQYNKIPILFRPNRPLILKDVYVPLKVTGPSTSAKIDSAEAVIQYPHLMITGAPGSGKSTMLKHILLSFLSRSPNQPIPILLELNRMNDPSKYLFNELVEVLNRNNFPNGENFVRYGLEDGNIILLMDALDEVSFTERPRVVQQIEDLSHKYPRCRLIVTCRTAVYNGELDDIANQTMEIAEFEDRQIRQFMGSWEREMPPEKSVNQLMETLYDRPGIMELARNPLMLTIIAYLYCDTPHELPHSRAEFYKISTDVLLRLWHGDIKDINKFSAPAKQSVLKHLALFNQDKVQQKGRRIIDYETIMEEIRKVLPSINLRDEDAEPLLKEIVDRSGLLISIDKRGMEYQFAHLTMQEYFAAYELGDDQDGLIQRYMADPDSWREPVKLWCGFGYDCTKLIETIFDKDYTMAFECLADAIKVDNKLANTIIQEFESRLLRNEAPEMVQKAFGVVASNIRSLRGGEVFNFLVKTLENQDVSQSIKHAAAMSISTTNLPQAAEVLAKNLLTIQECRSALIRMGELAVPALAKECGGEHANHCILALREIGTPSAAEAIVPSLWDSKNDIALVAAWSLGNLVQSKSVEYALRNYKFTMPMNEETLNWVWEPFKEPMNSSLRKICGRIAFILGNAGSIPDYLQEYKLDPRFSIPLCVADLGEKAYYEIEQFGWNRHMLSLRYFPVYHERKEGETYLFTWNEIPGKSSYGFMIFLNRNFGLSLPETTKINKIDGGKTISVSSDKKSLSLKLNDEKTKAILTIDDGRTDEFIVKAENDELHLYEQTNEKALKILENQPDAPRYLKSMDKRLQLDFVWRILSLGKKPMQSDWLNVLSNEVFDFGASWFYYLFLFIAGILSIISLGYIGWNIYYSQTLPSYWNGFLGFLIFAILYDWTIFLTSSEDFSFEDPDSFFGLIFGVIIFPIDLYDKIRSTYSNLSFSSLPLAVWTPAIGYFTTIFLLNFVSWLGVILFWIIIIAICISLWVIGKKKEGKSRNPLKGILDAKPLLS